MCNLLMKFQCLQSSIQQVVQTEQVMLVLLRLALEFCITVCHTSFNMQQLSEGLPQSCAVQLFLHVQQSSDSAICSHRVYVPWNSSFY